MVNLDSIGTAWQISLLFGAVLVLRWVWERINLWCEILSIAVSLVAAPLLILLLDQDWLRLLCMSGISLCAVVLAAYWLPPTDQARLVAFYRRIRPPGLWARTIAAGFVAVPVWLRILRLENTSPVQ